MSGRSWLEVQREAIERFGRQSEAAWSARIRFWTHVMTLEATVLGLTAGMLGFSGTAPSAWLVRSWIALLCAIAIGCVLMKLSLDLAELMQREGFQLAYDLSGIEARVESRELTKDSEEHKGLVVAAVYRHRRYGQVPIEQWTEKAAEIARRYEPQLPRFVNEARPARVVEWLFRRRSAIEAVFYTASLISIVFLMLAVTNPTRHRPAETPHQGVVPQLHSAPDSPSHPHATLPHRR